MQLVSVRDMPVLVHVTSTGKKRLRVDPVIAHALLAGVLAPATITIEHVGPMPRDGAVSAFSFGHAFAVVETVAALVAANVTAKVPPRTWKHAFGLRSNKGESRALASRLLPEAAANFARVKDDGRAEAALLAIYGALKGNVAHLVSAA